MLSCCNLRKTGIISVFSVSLLFIPCELLTVRGYEINCMYQSARIHIIPTLLNNGYDTIVGNQAVQIQQKEATLCIITHKCAVIQTFNGGNRSHPQ